MQKKKISPLYPPVKGLIRLFYKRIHVVGAEKLPKEPSIIVGNHAQMHGPLACEFYFPGKHYTWAAGQMMKLKEVPPYAFKDFWSYKPERTHRFYRLLSYVIAPLSVLLFNNANTIAVYHDMRIVSTFKNTIVRMEEGANVIIFPEHDVPLNNILYEFQEGFVDAARYYYRKTGRVPDFVPLYLAPALNRMYLGDPVRFDPDAPVEEERRRICGEMTRAITEIARSLPKHTVVPYRNVLKKEYPSNIPEE